VEKSTLLLLIILLGIATHVWSSRTAKSVAASTGKKLHSLPGFYGYFTSLWCVLPSLLVIGLWSSLEGSVITSAVLHTLPTEMTATTPEQISLIVNDIKNVVAGSRTAEISPEITAAADLFKTLSQRSNLLLTLISLALSTIGVFFARSKIAPDFQARNQVERVLTLGLIGCALVAILTTVGIVLSVLLESIRFFQMIPITDFLFGLKWSPQIAMRADQAGSSGAFGAIPLITGTMLISCVAMVVAVPIGLLSAIYLSEYATLKFRSIAKPLIEILAGIPTVVYGFFAALVVAPFIRDMGANIGLEVSSESALAAGLVMGIMIIPFVSSLSDDFINAVPQSLRDGAYALGATQAETIRQVIIPAALPGIVGGILLAVSRAIGETMIVVMAAGLSANLTANPLEAVTTVTTQIVTLLVGDQEFDSPKTLAAFALGLVLFLLTLTLNIIALRIVRKYREQYE
jgi:phosphate transport system permease protein